MKYTVPIFLLIVCCCASVLIANPNGQSFSVKGGGCSCHNDNESTNTTTLVTPTKTTVKPGEKIDFVISVQNSSRPRAGFAVAAVNDAFANVGTFTAGTGTRILQRQLVHSATKTFTGTPRSATWNFSWTAPTEPGTYTIYSVGNGASSGSSGDWRYSTPVTITVENLQSVEDIAELPSLFPNPATTSVTIPIPENMQGGTLQITSADGRIVQTIAEVSGNVAWDTRSYNGDLVPPGIYFISVDTGNRRRTQRAVIIR